MRTKQENIVKRNVEPQAQHTFANIASAILKVPIVNSQNMTM